MLADYKVCPDDFEELSGGDSVCGIPLGRKMLSVSGNQVVRSSGLCACKEAIVLRVGKNPKLG